MAPVLQQLRCLSLTCVMLAALLSACDRPTQTTSATAKTTRQDSSHGEPESGSMRAKTAKSVSGSTPTANKDVVAASLSTITPDSGQSPQDYYAALLGKYGQDYAACGPSKTTTPGTCENSAQSRMADERSVPGNVLVVLDASGSMAARMLGETKLQAAQGALLGFVRQLPDSVSVALRVYGHKGNNKESGKSASCAGTELLYPFQRLDVAQLESTIRAFKPVGWTPIAASLDAAAQDFANAPDPAANNVLYLVSDGIETCGGNPIAAARRLHESKVKVVVHVIGFDVDAQAARALAAVAKAGGGSTSAPIHKKNCARS